MYPPTCRWQDPRPRTPIRSIHTLVASTLVPEYLNMPDHASLYHARTNLPRTLPALFTLHAAFALLAVVLFTGLSGWTPWPSPQQLSADPLAVSLGRDNHISPPATAINITHGAARHTSHLNASSDFSHYILALYWPPSVLTKAAQRRALHMIRVRRVAEGFWTHGAWPAQYVCVVFWGGILMHTAVAHRCTVCVRTSRFVHRLVCTYRCVHYGYS